MTTLNEETELTGRLMEAPLGSDAEVKASRTSVTKEMRSASTGDLLIDLSSDDAERELLELVGDEATVSPSSVGNGSTRVRTPEIYKENYAQDEAFRESEDNYERRKRKDKSPDRNRYGSTRDDRTSSPPHPRHSTSRLQAASRHDRSAPYFKVPSTSRRDRSSSPGRRRADEAGGRRDNSRGCADSHRRSSEESRPSRDRARPSDNPAVKTPEVASPNYSWLLDEGGLCARTLETIAQLLLRAKNDVRGGGLCHNCGVKQISQPLVPDASVPLTQQHSTSASVALPPQHLTSSSVTLLPQYSTSAVVALPPQYSPSASVTLPPQQLASAPMLLPPQQSTSPSVSLPPQQLPSVSLPAQQSASASVPLQPQQSHLASGIKAEEQEPTAGATLPSTSIAPVEPVTQAATSQSKHIMLNGRRHRVLPDGRMLVCDKRGGARRTKSKKKKAAAAAAASAMDEDIVGEALEHYMRLDDRQCEQLSAALNGQGPPTGSDEMLIRAYETYRRMSTGQHHQILDRTMTIKPTDWRNLEEQR